jgi:anti-sigma B factor antagonist
MLEIVVEPENLVRLTGRLDASETDRASEAFDRLSGPVTADLAGLEYISSAGLSVLIVTHKRLLASGHSLKLIRLQPRVRNVITYAGLHKFLHLEES